MKNEDCEGEKPISRRELLGLVGASSTALIGGGFILLDDDSESVIPAKENVSDGSSRSNVDTPPAGYGDDVDETNPEPDGENDGVEHIGENIREHGAQPNPDDPSLEAAAVNTRALRSAASEAGTNGTIYVPEGEYYLGENGTTEPLTAFGRLQPAGISIVGGGPEQSLLGVTEHMDNDRNHNLLRYSDTDHGTLEFRDIRLEGNYENLGNLHESGTGSRAISFSRNAAIEGATFRNVWFRGWWLNAVRGRHFELDFERCTFEEIAIGVNQDSDGAQTGQPVTNRPPAGTTTEFRDCKFLQTSGNAVNVDDNTGTVRVLNCYIEGTGSGCFKHSGGGRLEIRNVYARAQSDFLKENLPVPSSKEPFYGRHFFKRLFNNTNDRLSVVMENVEFHDSTFAAVYTWQSPFQLSGDMIALHNASGQHDSEVFHEGRSGGNVGGLRNTDISRISVHDSEGVIFNLGHSDGEIQTLHRGANDVLGNISDLTITSDVVGGNPFRPDVPDEDEVGH